MPNSGLKLNPLFSLWLMGYPAEWAYCVVPAMHRSASSRGVYQGAFAEQRMGGAMETINGHTVKIHYGRSGNALVYVDNEAQIITRKDKDDDQAQPVTGGQNLQEQARRQAKRAARF
jgi:hypothetical protein